jgi:hypothetical protein
MITQKSDFSHLHSASEMPNALFAQCIIHHQALQETWTASVRYRCVTDVFFSGVTCPMRKASSPACAIMIPLSMQKLPSACPLGVHSPLIGREHPSASL